jgi:hypothetical protein
LMASPTRSSAHHMTPCVPNSPTRRVMRTVPFDAYRMRMNWKHTDVPQHRDDRNDQ